MYPVGGGGEAESYSSLSLFTLHGRLLPHSWLSPGARDSGRLIWKMAAETQVAGGEWERRRKGKVAEQTRRGRTLGDFPGGFCLCSLSTPKPEQDVVGPGERRVCARQSTLLAVAGPRVPWLQGAPSMQTSRVWWD